MEIFDEVPSYLLFQLLITSHTDFLIRLVTILKLEINF